MLYVEPGFCIFAAALLMLLPVSWVFAAFVAAVWHELFHIAAILCVGGGVERIHMKACGAVIETKLSGVAAEIIVALAGPAGSFALLFFSDRFPKLAVCGLIQGLYNMIPVRQQDGGRVLAGFLAIVSPSRSERIMKIIECVFAAVAVSATIYGTVLLKLGIWPIIAVIIFVTPRIRRKIPCKRGQIRVQ